MKPKKILSIGWDVGGWMGKKQGFSVSLWDNEEKSFVWINKSKEFGLPKSHLLSLTEIIDKFINQSRNTILKEYQIIVAIDAPLGYPDEYVKFINGVHGISSKPDKEINNKLAYRDTERHIYKKFGKKPLSASFDKLGNNATVAITHTRKWIVENGFVLQPSEMSGEREIIEVYPALIKDDVNLLQLFDAVIPNDVKINSDAYDSAICSLLGLKYYIGNELFGIPRMHRPEITEKLKKKDGYIIFNDNIFSEVSVYGQ